MKRIIVLIVLLFLFVGFTFGQKHPCLLHIDPSREGQSNDGYKYYIEMTITKSDGTTVLFVLDQDDEEKKKEINYFLNDYPRKITCEAYKNKLETSKSYYIDVASDGSPYYTTHSFIREPIYMSEGKLIFHFKSTSGLKEYERAAVDFYLLPLTMKINCPQDFYEKQYICEGDKLSFSWNIEKDFQYDLYDNKYPKIIASQRSTDAINVSDLINSKFDYYKKLSITVEPKMHNKVDNSNVTLSFPLTVAPIYPDYPIEDVNPYIWDNHLRASLRPGDTVSVFSFFEPDVNKDLQYNDYRELLFDRGEYNLTFYREKHCPVQRQVSIPSIDCNYVGDKEKKKTFWYGSLDETREALSLVFWFLSQSETYLPYNFEFSYSSNAEVVYEHSTAHSTNASVATISGGENKSTKWIVSYPIKTNNHLSIIYLTPTDPSYISITIADLFHKLRPYYGIKVSDSIVHPHCNYDDAILYLWGLQGGLELNEYKYKINNGEENTFKINSSEDTVKIPLKDHTLNDFTLKIYDPEVNGDSEYGRIYRSITKEHLSVIRHPELKINSFESQDLRCHNDSSGSIEIKSVQRTYDDKELEYHWFKYPYTDELAFRSNKADHLPADSYRLVIFNDGCKDTSHYTITQPDTLLTSITSVTNAMCYGYHDGAITTDTSGGTQPLSFSWSNGATTKDIDHLPIGRYYVTVTDAHGCKADANDTITQPAELINSLTPGYTICKGGELAIDDGRDNMKEFDSYEWHLPDSTIVHDRPIVVTTAMPQGKYALMSKKDVPGKKGKYCFTTDTTLITFADNDLPIRFLVPTESFFDDTLVIAEDSEIDDYYTWHYAYNHDMFTDITKRMTADSTQTFLRIERFGNDTITMYAENGFCKASLSKAVTIHPESRPEDYDYTVDAEGIFSRLQIGPNPNNGEFTLFANLTEDSPLTIALYDVSHSRKIPIDFTKYKTPASHYQIPFQGLGLHSGAYTLLVSANGETKQIKFVVE